MTRDVQELLRAAVPEPPATLDPHRVLMTARRRQRRRRSAVVLSGAAVVAGAVFAVGQFRPAAQDPSLASSPPRLSALEHRVQLREVALSALDGERLRHPGEGSLVGSMDSDNIYLAEAANGDLCLFEASESYGSGGGGCHPASDLLTTGILLTIDYPPGFPLEQSHFHLLVVAPDGYTQATSGGRRAEIHNNVAVVPLPNPAPSKVTEVTVTGPGMQTLTFSTNSP